jgi:hypothetical protein
LLWIKVFEEKTGEIQDIHNSKVLFISGSIFFQEEREFWIREAKRTNARGQTT